MYTKRRIMFCMTILTLFLVPLASKVASAQTFRVSVTPSSATVGLGQQVIVNVTVANADSLGLYSYELKLYYNTTALNATDAQIPSDHMLKPVQPSRIFIVDPGTINQDLGYVSFALTMLGEEAGKTGNGTLVTVTFKGLVVGNSPLDLPHADLILVDSNGNQIAEENYGVDPGLIHIVPEFAVAVLIAAFAIMSGAAVVLKKRLK
jgi:hypothetical protein